MPSCVTIFSTFQRLPSFLDVVKQQPQLAGYEIRIVRITSPGADIDDVQRLIDEVADGDELIEDEGRCIGQGR